MLRHFYNYFLLVHSTRTLESDFSVIYVTFEEYVLIHSQGCRIHFLLFMKYTINLVFTGEPNN